MKKKILALLGIILIMAVVIVPIALASNYVSTLDFTHIVNGSTRYYDNDDIHCHISEAYCSIYSSMTIELWEGAYRIGIAYGQTTGYSNAHFYDKGSGNYGFRFIKPMNGARMTSDYVRMYSD